jgi:cyclopropane fatty-acyl-phospholipid synthase-like methyltransferase
MKDDILNSVNNYYTEKVKEHGITPKGVDWNSLESQEMRFEQLCKVIEVKENFSVLDYGCGYGALFNYLTNLRSSFTYTGFDISAEMISQALKLYGDAGSAKWSTAVADNERFDYSIASGIFNVRLGTNDAEWIEYIKESLSTINKHSEKGFSFNMLTSYSDKEYMRNYLFYADPAYFFDFCKKNFSKYVALLHDYPLYEFTILVKK